MKSSNIAESEQSGSFLRIKGNYIDRGSED
jgi:hypothetical protein